MSWTDERVELLKKLWNEGKSASAIAKELGGVTRNAVIGKVHRLGLSNRGGAAGAKSTARSASRPAAAEPAPGKAASETPAETPAQAADAAPAAADGADRAAPDTAPEAGAPGGADAPETGDQASGQPVPQRRPVVKAGQPLPPQPSANEVSEETRATVREVEKRALKLTLMELTERTCKWPIGDPATRDFWFCGHPVKPGKPYCEAHVALAFQPMSARRDRRASR